MYVIRSRPIKMMRQMTNQRAAIFTFMAYKDIPARTESAGVMVIIRPKPKVGGVKLNSDFIKAYVSQHDESQAIR